ncbi:MAG: hypothetical protein JW741_22020 [Sedimentisphaerales bacterium]|nr:hypothetical protein [Sedimentisphaerales bacterium]
MLRKSAILLLVSFFAVVSVPAGAQDNLGDLVTEAGYAGMLGKWTAVDDQGRENHLEFKWALDKHVILVDVQINQFKYHGMIMFVASSQEVVQIGADNMGGTWKGTWSEDYEGIVNRSERLNADGTKEKVEHVYIKVDANTFKVKEYAVESDGWRASSPRGELTFKSRKSK